MSAAKTATAVEAPTASEELQDEALDQIDLSGAPPLRPVGTFRARQRAHLFQEVQRISDGFGADAEEGATEDDVDLGRLDLVADIDELLESVAVDPTAYAAWATEDGGGPNLEQRIVALFSRFARDLGKSQRSAS